MGQKTIFGGIQILCFFFGGGGRGIVWRVNKIFWGWESSFFFRGGGIKVALVAIVEYSFGRLKNMKNCQAQPRPSSARLSILYFFMSQKLFQPNENISCNNKLSPGSRNYFLPQNIVSFYKKLSFPTWNWLLILQFSLEK